MTNVTVNLSSSHFDVADEEALDRLCQRWGLYSQTSMNGGTLVGLVGTTSGEALFYGTAGFEEHGDFFAEFANILEPYDNVTFTITHAERGQTTFTLHIALTRSGIVTSPT